VLVLASGAEERVHFVVKAPEPVAVVSGIENRLNSRLAPKMVLLPYILKSLVI
jgi:hypothetical protein